MTRETAAGMRSGFSAAKDCCGSDCGCREVIESAESSMMDEGVVVVGGPAEELAALKLRLGVIEAAVGKLVGAYAGTTKASEPWRAEQVIHPGMVRLADDEVRATPSWLVRAGNDERDDVFITKWDAGMRAGDAEFCAVAHEVAGELKGLGPGRPDLLGALRRLRPMLADVLAEQPVPVAGDGDEYVTAYEALRVLRDAGSAGAE
jgi:hypothetical protein